MRIAFLAITLLAAGCVTAPSQQPVGSCGGWDGGPWVGITPPANASAFRRVADDHPNFPGSNSYGSEDWFATPTGQVLLCRSDSGPTRSCSGQWWRFAPNSDPPGIEEQDGWICVT